MIGIEVPAPSRLLFGILSVMAKLVGNVSILIAGSLVMIAGLIAAGLILVGATSIVLVAKTEAEPPGPYGRRLRTHIEDQIDTA